MIEFLKHNILSFILLILSGLIFIYSLYSNYKPTSINTTKVDNQLKLDSLRSKIEEDYRSKIDSISSIYNIKINNLEQKDKLLDKKDSQLYDKLKDLNTDIGNLPNFN